MVPVLREVLEAERLRQQQVWSWDGKKLSDKAAVIQNNRGSTMRPNTLTAEFKAFIREMPNVSHDASLKSLRSGMASLLAYEGVPMSVIAWLLGDHEETVRRFYAKNVNDKKWVKLSSIIAAATDVAT